jgi:thiol-disulfide isomerase/thioredoxin
VVTPYLEQNFPLNEEKNSAEIERLLNYVIEKYGDVPVMDWELSGPGNMLLHAVPFRQPKTYGELAKAMLFELNSIVPGKQAPDIEGIDADGKRFRLSDYRGKVVLLTFSADWCGSCVNLYPLERKLVEEFRNKPFVMLSVSRDEKIDTLKSSIDAGEITWRCWRDGIDGPIARAWNCRYIPRIILLDDQQVFQNINFSRFSSQEEFEREISSLLRKVPAKPAPAMDR